MHPVFDDPLEVHPADVGVVSVFTGHIQKVDSDRFATAIDAGLNPDNVVKAMFWQGASHFERVVTLWIVVDEIRELLTASAEDIGLGPDQQGSGLVNANAALEELEAIEKLEEKAVAK